MAQRPSSRDDFEIAIICALPLEYDAVALLFDVFWDQNGDTYGRAAGDSNTYTTGRIGKHDIVLALLPCIGKVNAAVAATNLRSSYGALGLVILAGICGGAPFNGQNEVLLGDVILSKTVVQYDFGRQYPGRFIRKDTTESNLSKQNKNVRNLLAIFETHNGKNKLQERTALSLAQLQSKGGKHRVDYSYPGVTEDTLFEPSYLHKHRTLSLPCSECHGATGHVCDDSLVSSCSYLGCDRRYLVKRERLEQQDKQNEDPMVHIGTIASGDKVMKSGEDRDKISETEGVIAFEMEGAGIWEQLPCIIVKGVCDYADGHKNKKWQNFAAATAASALKAILEQYIPTDKVRGSCIQHPQTSYFLVPFGRNQNFIGRESILSAIQERILPSANRDDCQRIAIQGLGGVGKTQIALEAIYLLHHTNPDYSIFWVPAVDVTSFENAYRDIGKLIKARGLDDDTADIKRLVQSALSDESLGNWLLVIDNADDFDLLFSTASLLDYLPFSRNGSILFTTRNHKMALRLDISQADIFSVEEMNRTEALNLLKKCLNESQTSDMASTTKLLDALANLPLAIRQASAFMAANQIPTSEYLKLYESDFEDVVDLLSRDFEDRYRYRNTPNPVATTWLVSFSQIFKQNQLAAEYLKLMSLLMDKDIPKFILPAAKEIETTEAIGTLKAYAFIIQREGQDSNDMHRLVRLAMRNWLETEGELEERVCATIMQLDRVFPTPRYDNKDVWTKLLPHAQAALALQQQATHEEAKGLLLDKISICHFYLGNYYAQEKLHRQSFALREEVLGIDHAATRWSMTYLALALTYLGKEKEAESTYRKTIELTENVPGTDDEKLVLKSLLANVLKDLEQYIEAEELHREVLGIYERKLGEGHPSTLQCKMNLANVIYFLGRPEESEQMHRQTTKLYQQVLGMEHPETLDSMHNLAYVLSGVNRNEEAEQVYRQTIKSCEKVLGAEHPVVLTSMHNLAGLLAGAGNHEEAEQKYRQTLKSLEKVLGAVHPYTLRTRSSLADLLVTTGRFEEAEHLYR